MTSTCCSATGEFIESQSPTSLLVTDKLNTIWENRWVYIILFTFLLHFCFGSHKPDGDLWAFLLLPWLTTRCSARRQRHDTIETCDEHH